MSSVLAFLAGLGGGAMSESIRQKDKARQDKFDQIEFDRADAEKQQRARQQAMQTKMADASAPVQVQDGATVSGIAPTPATYTDSDVAASDVRQARIASDRTGVQTPATATPAIVVNGQQYPTMQAATQAATAANDPAAVANRQAQVMATMGDPLAAQRLRTGARQEQLGQLQLDAAQKEAIDKEFDRHLQGAGDFDGIAKIISDSKADGQGGALKVQAVPSADGKTVAFVKVNPDGTTSPTPYQFEKSPKGLLEAQQTLARLTPTEAKLTHLHQNAQEAQAAAQLAQQAKQHAESNATTLEAARIHARATIEAATKRAAASSAKGWTFYKDKEGALLRFNPNAGLVEKQLPGGAWEQTDELPEGLTKLGAMAGGGAMNQRFAGRVIGAANEGFAAIASIAKLSDPNSGIFSSKAMSGSDGKNALVGAFTPEKVKRYNATIAGLANEIATAQNQGMAPHEEQIKAVREAITIGPTDDDVTKRYRVALAARYLRKGIEPSMDLANPDQKKRAEALLKDLAKIPDPDDIETQNKGKGMFPKGAQNGRRSSSPAPEVPKAGTVQDGYRFKGGDPAKQENWEKA
jgi:hypothetical protein